MTNTKRGLSILLVLVLFITSIGIGFSMGGLKGDMPETETVSKTAVDNYAIHFYVPETIYLTPSIGNMSTFKYYVDSTNSTTPALSTDKTKTTGNVYFYSANATDLSIACSGATVTMGTTTGSTTVNTTITAGALSTAIAQNTSSVLTWTATYKVGGVSMTAKAYTVCYAPLVNPLGVAVRTFNDDGSGRKDKADFQGFAWIVGVHGLGTGGVYQGNTSGARSLMMDNISNFTGNDVPTSWLTAATNGGFTYQNKTFGDDRYTVVHNSPTGTLTVDSSRYSNINQIPNLSCGYAITHTQEMDQGQYLHYASNFSATNAGWHYNNETSTDNNFQNTVIRDEESPVIFTGSTASRNMTNGIQYNGNVWSQPLVDYNIARMKVGSWGNNNDEYNAIAFLVNVNLNKVNKGSLRSNIRYYTNLGLQAADYTNDASDFTAFTNELAAAAERLGNVTGNGASDTLATKYAALTKNSFTATINHQFSNGKTTITETQTYNSGDTVNFAPNTYPGYTHIMFVLTLLKSGLLWCLSLIHI